MSDLAVPTLMLFSAAKEDWQDADYEQEFALAAFGGEVLEGEVLDYVTFIALGDEGLDVKVDVVDEPVLMRYSATSTEDVQTMGDLAEVDPSAEIMLYAAMGPSPWQNLDNPDDVNVDGSTTPFDALLVINRINEGISLSAVATSETIWYEGGWNDDSAWQETDTTEPSDGVEGDAKFETEDARLAVPRLAQRDEALDADSLDQEKTKAEVDDELFSEDTDWLLADVI